MKQIFKTTIILIFIAFLTANTVSSEEKHNDDEYIMGDISTLPADFNLDVSVSADSGNLIYENGIPIIDGICTFRVSRNDNKDTSSSFYNISFFEFDKFTDHYKGRSLPFVMKRNYRGIKDGTYSITFVAKDESGKTGKGSIRIQVKH